MILAIDTATRWTGVALHDGTAIIAELGWRAKNTQTIELAAAVADILRKTGVDAADLKGVAVANGPGSYTGLRVGLAFAKGFALAHNLPMVGVPTLDIVAHSFGAGPAQLVVVAEAGRTRVCSGVYRWNKRKGWLMRGEAEIESWAELLARLQRETTFAGEVSAEAKKMIRASDKPFSVVPAAANPRRAGYLAQLAWPRFRRGKTDDPAMLSPNYLRTPDGQKTSDT